MSNVNDVKSFLEVPDELKLDYYTVILENNACVIVHFLCFSHLSID